MRIFKTKALARFSKTERNTDASLVEAVGRAGRGLIDADLGGGLIKQRVARGRQGRSGGYRMVLGIRGKDRAVFVFGFAKSDMDSIGEKQLASLKEIAAIWLAADEDKLHTAKAQEILFEVNYGG